MIDISKIKPGDMVTLVPLEVLRVAKDGFGIWVAKIGYRGSDNGIDWVTIDVNDDQIAAHHPAPREIGVGDRVKVAPANPALIAGTVEHIARGKARVIWDNGDDTLYSVSDLTRFEAG
jgi:hypothetical protein